MVAIMVELHSDADQIESIFHRHRLDARVAGGILASTSERFELVCRDPAGTTLAALRAVTSEIARLLGRASCRLFTQRGIIYLEVPRLEAPPDAVRLSDLMAMAGKRPPHSALLGLSLDGRPLLWRPSGTRLPHLVVEGPYASGKRAVLEALTLSLVEGEGPRAWRVVLLDIASNWPHMTPLPHVWGHGMGAAAAIGWLVRLELELERRLGTGSGESTDGPSPRVLIVVDEVGELLRLGGPTAQAVLGRLLDNGASHGFHVAAAATDRGLLVELSAAFPLFLRAPINSTEAGHGWFVAETDGGASLRLRAPCASPHDVALVLHRQRGRPRVVAGPPHVTARAADVRATGGESGSAPSAFRLGARTTVTAVSA